MAGLARTYAPRPPPPFHPEAVIGNWPSPNYRHAESISTIGRQAAAPVQHQKAPPSITLKPAAVRSDPAYITLDRAQQSTEAVLERVMDTPITLTQRKLLSLAPEIRAQLVEATVMRRVHSKPPVQATTRDIANEAVPTQSRRHEEAMAAHMPAAFALAAGISPADTAVTTDPFDVYLCGHNLGLEELSSMAESATPQDSPPAIDSQERTEVTIGLKGQEETGPKPEGVPEAPAWSKDQTIQHPKQTFPENSAPSREVSTPHPQNIRITDSTATDTPEPTPVPIPHSIPFPCRVRVCRHSVSLVPEHHLASSWASSTYPPRLESGRKPPALSHW
jgi:hypothetical protein